MVYLIWIALRDVARTGLLGTRAVAGAVARAVAGAVKKLCFDSYGLRPPDELVEYLQRPVLYKSERVKTEGQVFCGHLCLLRSQKAERWR